MLSSGLLSGPGAKPVNAYPFIASVNKWISALTDGSIVMDSTDAAIALVALRRQTESLTAAAALQHAWYVDGSSLSDVEVHRGIATDLGLDVERVLVDLPNPATWVEALGDFAEVRRL